MPTPVNQIASIIGDTIIISAVSERETGPAPFVMPNEVITFQGITFPVPPNVQLTIGSPHYVVSPIWISTTGFGLVSNKVGEPGGPQNANINILIHGKLPGGFAAQASEIRLHSALEQ